VRDATLLSIPIKVFRVAVVAALGRSGGSVTSGSRMASRSSVMRGGGVRLITADIDGVPVPWGLARGRGRRRRIFGGATAL
jgi:hypothetical protein